MIHFNIFDSEPHYLFLSFDDDNDYKTLKSLEQYLNRVPDICYLPQYRGLPYKIEFLYKRLNSSGKTIYYCAIGLWQVIYKFFKKNNIQFDGLTDKCLKYHNMPDFETFKDIVNSWNLKFTPRPYQYEAAYKILCWKSSLSELATRAGKTLISYIIFRYSMEFLSVKKILMIVPSISLVKQGYSDFKEYGDFFNTECIWAGGKEVTSSNLTIGTFQSLIKYLDRKSSKYNPSFYKDFDLVFVDEVHRATATQVKQIITQDFFYKCKLVFGMTGTLPKDNTIERFTLHALLGARIQDISAKELMDEHYISNIKIHQVQIEYPQNEKLDNLYIKAAEYLISDYVLDGKKKQKQKNPHFLYKYIKKLPGGVDIARKQLSKEGYLTYLKDLILESDSTNNLLLERMVIHELNFRLTYLKEIIENKMSVFGNVLILTHHTEYTEYVYKELTSKFPNRKIYKITGAITPKKRTEILEGMKNNKGSILVASYGCMSTGITLPDLHYGVLFESFKSNTVNLQSLGRGLGKSDGKDIYEVWDFVDILPTKKIKGQGQERIKTYKNQMYPYDIIKVKS